jgi:phospholipase D1/2
VRRDPEQPVTSRDSAPDRSGGGFVRRWWWVLVVPVVGVGIALAWLLTPLGDLADAEGARRLVESARAGPGGAARVLVVFIVAASVGFPVTLLVVVVGATFDVWIGVPICLVGVGVSSMLGFAIGRALPWRVGDGDGGVLRRTVERLGDHGVLAVVALRNMPIAPYVVVNVVCGAARTLTPVAFLVGTVIGMLPGVLLVGLFGDQLGEVIRSPTWGGVARVVGAAGLIVAAAFAADAGLRRWLSRVPSSGGRGDDRG